MKNKWIKRFGILFAFVFLFIGTGCTSNPYKGSFCGNAKNPSTEYGKIRFSYIVDYTRVMMQIIYLFFIQITIQKKQMKSKPKIIKKQ